MAIVIIVHLPYITIETCSIGGAQVTFGFRKPSQDIVNDEIIAGAPGRQDGQR